jgi:hypothetical protein
MQYRLRTLLIVSALLALAETVNAQPVFIRTHNWTVEVGGRSFGITEDLAYGDIRSTTIHLGPYYFDTKLSALQVAGLGVTLPAILLMAVGVFAISARRRK